MKKLILILLLFSSNAWAISLGSIPAIKSIQYGSVADAGTATINEVDTNFTVIASAGFTTIATSNADNMDSYMELTNSTTISAAGSSSGGAVNIAYIALEFVPSAVKRIINSSISIDAPATTGTYSISPPVVPGNTLVFYRGMNGNEGGDYMDDYLCRVQLSDATTVTAYRAANSGNVVVYFSLVELNSWVTQ